MKREGMEWLISGENEEYFAEEILRISRIEQQAWSEAAQSCFDVLRDTAQRLIREKQWDDLGIPSSAQRLVSYSIAHEWDDYFLGRFDFAGGLGDYPIKMLEFNADTCSLIPETAHVQRHLWVEMKKREGNGPYDQLLSSMTRYFEQLLRRYPDKEPHLLLSTLGYEEDWLNIEVIAEAARTAGFEEVQMAELQDVIFDPINGLFIETRSDQFVHFDFWYKMIPWDFIANQEPELMDLLSNMVIDGKVKILNPAWTMAIQSKGILPYVQAFNPEHPNLLKAAFSATPFSTGRYARKPLFGRTGENVALFDGGSTPIAETNGDYSRQALVYQELASFEIDLEGYRYQPSVFYCGQAAAIGIRRQDDLIIDDDAEFIGHTIT